MQPYHRPLAICHEQHLRVGGCLCNALALHQVARCKLRLSVLANQQFIRSASSSLLLHHCARCVVTFTCFDAHKTPRAVEQMQCQMCSVHLRRGFRGVSGPYEKSLRGQATSDSVSGLGVALDELLNQASHLLPKAPQCYGPACQLPLRYPHHLTQSERRDCFCSPARSRNLRGHATRSVFKQDACMIQMSNMSSTSLTLSSPHPLDFSDASGRSTGTARKVMDLVLLSSAIKKSGSSPMLGLPDLGRLDAADLMSVYELVRDDRLSCSASTANMSRLPVLFRVTADPSYCVFFCTFTCMQRDHDVEFSRIIQHSSHFTS